MRDVSVEFLIARPVERGRLSVATGSIGGELIAMPDPAHRRRRRHGRQHWLLATTIVVVCVVAVTATVLVLTRQSDRSAAADSGSRPPGKPASLQVVATTPAPAAVQVPTDTALSVRFTVPLASDSPVPALDPPLAGTWLQATPGTLVFEASTPLPPGSTVSVTVPAGPAGVRGARGQLLADSLTAHFTVAPMSTLRMQQLLATLGYLPVSFSPASTSVAPTELATPQVGSFSWRWTTWPGAFLALWAPGEPNVITQGAVMAFESEHNLATDGVAGPQVWEALLQAAVAGQADSYGHYDWVDVSTSRPEQVRVWRDGQLVYSTAANTGIEAAPTELGTWPVYARYTSTTMSGTNPDGSKYKDPGVPWVSYFHGGDALHGFIRASYGSPQSLGCVEMPPSNAQVVYPYTPLGTPVTVE